MKHLPVLLAALVGLVVGFFAGRTSSPATAAGESVPVGTRASSAAVSDVGVADNAADARPAQAASTKLQPLTPDMLASELKRLEAAEPGGAFALRSMAELQDRLKVSDLPGLVSALAASPAADRDRSVGLIFRAFAEKNPQQAWSLAFSLQDPPMRRSALVAVLSVLGSSNPEQAISMAEGVKEDDLLRQLRGMAFNTLASRDPARAFTIAMRSPGAADFSFTNILAQWLRKDPEAAKAAAASLKGKQADTARMAIVHELARQDPKAAWDYASHLAQAAGSDAWTDPRMQVIRQWAQSDPAGAVAAALGVQDAERRNQFVASAVGAWASSDFESALAYAVQIEDANTRGRILQNLANTQNADRSRMFDVLMEHAPSGDSFRSAMTSLVHQWARENPREAAMAVKQLPPSRSFSHLASMVAGAWASGGADKMEVFGWARSLPEGQSRVMAVNSLFEAWARQDPAGALGMLSSLGADERGEASEGVVNGWSRTAPAAAAAWAASLPAGRERDNALRSAMSRWIQSSPADVTAFVARLPEGERASVTGSMMSAWASRDAASAAAWLQRQPAGKAKDEGLRALSRQISQEDPESALAWANTISEPQARANQTESLAREWLALDPANAKKWISASPLPPETVQRLMK